MEIKSAFLNGDLQEEAYVQQPAGFVNTGAEHKTLRLKKAMYGLHQAPRAWNSKLDDTLLSLSFNRCPSEPVVYTRRAGGEQLVIGVYVNDLMITRSNSEDIQKFKSEMAQVFKMSDLGLLYYYLGMENHLKLSNLSEAAPVDKTLYMSVVSSPRYLVNTRPDISFIVGYVSQFLEDPREDHMAAVKHIVRYIAGTYSWGLWFSQKKGKEAVLIVYSDSDYAVDMDKRKSTTGVISSLSSPVS
jgi:hypothetical protein